MRRLLVDVFGIGKDEPSGEGPFFVRSEWGLDEGPFWQVASYSPRVDSDGTEHPHWWAAENDADCTPNDLWMYLPEVEE